VSIARALDFRARVSVGVADADADADASSEDAMRETRGARGGGVRTRTSRWVFVGGGKDASTGEPAPFWARADAVLEGGPSDARTPASRCGGGGGDDDDGVSSVATMRWEALDDDDDDALRPAPYLTSGVLVVSGDAARAGGWLPPGVGTPLVNTSPSEFTVAPTEVPRDAWKCAPAVLASTNDAVDADADAERASPWTFTLPAGGLRPVSIEFAAVRGLRDDDPFMAAAIRFLKTGEIDDDDDVFSRLAPEDGLGEISWVSPPRPRREPRGGESETEKEARGEGAIAGEVGGGVRPR
jgi:hypothetical protein